MDKKKATPEDVLSLERHSNEASEWIGAWRNGEVTWEEALMGLVVDFDKRFHDFQERTVNFKMRDSPIVILNQKEYDEIRATFSKKGKR